MCNQSDSKLYLLCIFVFVIFNLYSAWLDDVPTILIQPDGIEIDAFASGDEYHNWTHDRAGYTIIQDSQSGYWCWANVNNTGDIFSTGMPIHQHTPQSLNISPKANISSHKYREKREQWSREGEQRNIRTTRSTGEVHNLVIFIRFSDQDDYEQPAYYYEEMFNGYGDGVNSQYQYFWEVSYGQLETFSHLYPIALGDIVLSYQDIYPRSYYMPYNAVTNPDGYQEWARTEREMLLLERAIYYVENEISPDIPIDSDNDGYVDNICFIIKGGTTAWSTLLWPHQWALYYQPWYLGYDVMIHNKIVWSFNLTLEDFLEYSGVSVLAHELAHTFGIPDLYRYEHNGYPIGIWDIMAKSIHTPQSMTAYLKWRYTDWITTLPVISTAGTYTLNPLSTSSVNNIYRINIPSYPTQYLVLEYRNKELGVIDSTLPGSGLLIYRVDTTAGWGNDYGPPDELYVFRLNGTPSNDGELNNAYFSAESGRTAFNNFTNPYPFLTNATTVSGVSISNISSAGETISFDVSFDTISQNPPQNLLASAGNGEVTLQWQPSSSVANLIRYRIYRDSMPIAEVTDEVLTYTDTVSNGFSYKYFVTALFPSSESVASNTQTVSLHIDQLRPVVNLTASFSQNNYVLNWDLYTAQSGTLTYTQSDIHLDEFIENKATNYAIAQRWTPEQLIEFGMAGSLLTSVSFYAININATYSVKIWTGGSDYPLSAGTLVHQQQINNLLLNQWTTTQLSSPVEIPFHTELWIGIHINTSLRGIPIALDNGPIEDRYSNILLIGDGVFTIMDVMNLQPYNWMIKGHCTTPSDTQLTGFLGYNIYRDDTLLTPTPITQQTYIVSNGSHSYKVIATYETGSAQPALITLDNNSVHDELEKPMMTKLIGNYPNPFNPSTTILFTLNSQHSNLNSVQIIIYNIKGQKVKTVASGLWTVGKHEVVWDGTDDLSRPVSSGLYFYRMQTDDHIETRKMFLIK